MTKSTLQAFPFSLPPKNLFFNFAIPASHQYSSIPLIISPSNKNNSPGTKLSYLSCLPINLSASPGSPFFNAAITAWDFALAAAACGDVIVVVFWTFAFGAWVKGLGSQEEMSLPLWAILLVVEMGVELGWGWRFGWMDWELELIGVKWSVLWDGMGWYVAFCMVIEA
jgi:hypothetical protein